jgi:hypothetical protein
MTSSSLKIGFGAGCGGVCCAAAEIANKNGRTNRWIDINDDEGTLSSKLSFRNLLFARKLRAKYINPQIVPASCSLEGRCTARSPKFPNLVKRQEPRD